MKKAILYSVYIAIGLLIIFCAAGNFYTYLHQNDWKSNTTPLPKESIDVLCSSFGLKQDDPLCSDDKDIYGPDFYDTIRDAFRPSEEHKIKSSESATYDEVEEKLGVFKYECETVTQQVDGFAYFRCFYDLRGDRQFRMVIFYNYPEMTVFRIVTPMGND